MFKKNSLLAVSSQFSSNLYSDLKSFNKNQRIFVIKCLLALNVLSFFTLTPACLFSLQYITTFSPLYLILSYLNIIWGPIVMFKGNPQFKEYILNIFRKN